MFIEKKLDANVVRRNSRHTTQHGAIDGKFQERDIQFYNLDVIISVGYRVKSPQGTKFRIWAISKQTAAELVHNRVDSSKPLLGMKSFDKKSTKITKQDVSVSKNYLEENELRLLGLIVEQYLAFAETMVRQHIPMYMKIGLHSLIPFMLKIFNINTLVSGIPFYELALHSLFKPIVSLCGPIALSSSLTLTDRENCVICSFST